MSRKAMPTDEMGHPPSSADAPPPLTSGEIEAAVDAAVDWATNEHKGDIDIVSLVTFMRLKLSGGSAGKGNTSAAGAEEAITEAIKRMDAIGRDWKADGQMQKFYATNYLVEAIRPLMTAPFSPPRSRQMAETELKPCPFCGDSAILCGLGGYHEVECTNCNAITQYTRSEAEAIAAWNRRTPPSTAGWVLVPIEPTATQVDAMHSAIGGTGDIGRHYIRILYRSAVNSAPSQEGEGRLRDVDEQTDHELRAGELWD